MNKQLILIICTLITCINCEKQEGKIYNITETIYLINESSQVVISDETLGYVIQPSETIIHKETNSLDGDRPSVDEYFLSFTRDGNHFKYGNGELNCEKKIHDINFYENRKEVSDLNFEFTFRFTEERRNNSEPCE